jgi:hypothetical protein
LISTVALPSLSPLWLCSRSRRHAFSCEVRLSEMTPYWPSSSPCSQAFERMRSQSFSEKTGYSGSLIRMNFLFPRGATIEYESLLQTH